MNMEEACPQRFSTPPTLAGPATDGFSTSPDSTYHREAVDSRTARVAFTARSPPTLPAAHGRRADSRAVDTRVIPATWLVLNHRHGPFSPRDGAWAFRLLRDQRGFPRPGTASGHAEGENGR